MSCVLGGFAVFALSVHVGSEFAAWATTATPGLPPIALSVGLGLAATHACVVFRPKVTTLGGAGTALLLGTAAYALGLFDVFARAYAASAVLFACLLLLHERGQMAMEDPTPHTYVSVRAAAYASVRSLSHLAVHLALVPDAAARLLPFFLLGVVETAGMYVCGNSYYAFAPVSSAFLAYANLKAALFLALPWVEDSASSLGLLPHL